jgi:hypothetical protein
MSESKNVFSHDYSKFDTMSTDSLNIVLRRDAQLADGESSDMNAILHIMDILAKREADNAFYNFTDTDAAWKSLYNRKS